MNSPTQSQPTPKSLVLVVGAGASAEVGLPLGSKLKERIAQLLDIRSLRNRSGEITRYGDLLIDEAFRLLVRQLGGSQGDIIRAAWRIRDAMPQAISIDNFIDAHRGNELIEKVGKLAIVRSILEAEERSKLAINTSNIHNRLNFEAVENTWFTSFFKLLTENCQAESLPQRFRQAAIVCFNYDRCIEHYLFNALQNYYGISADSAAAALADLEIYHPYGTVGQLPWAGKTEGIAYGAQPSANQLVQLATHIHTFTEGSNIDESDIAKVRSVLNKSKRIAFLGFAFHRLNLELLFPPQPNGSGKKKDCFVFATGKGISAPNREAIENELVSLVCVNQRMVEIAFDTSCAELFADYSRKLSFR